MIQECRPEFVEPPGTLLPEALRKLLEDMAASMHPDGMDLWAMPGESEYVQNWNIIIQQLFEESVRQLRLAERTAEKTVLAAHYAEIAANNAEACAWIRIAN